MISGYTSHTLGFETNKDAIFRPAQLGERRGAEFDLRRPVGSFLDTTSRMVASPISFFKDLNPEREPWPPLAFAGICSLLVSVATALVGPVGVVRVGEGGVDLERPVILHALLLTPVVLVVAVWPLLLVLVGLPSALPHALQ